MQIEVGSTLWFLIRDRAALVSLVFLIAVALAAIFAPLLTPYAAQGMGNPDLPAKFKRPASSIPLARMVSAEIRSRV